MEKKRLGLASGIFLIIVLVFFYPSLLKAKIPFPGDLLIGHYAPWNGYSYDGYTPGGVTHKGQGIDVVRELFPWKVFTIQTLRQSQWPWWNPYNFAGNVHMANFQTAVFYPLGIVFLILPFNVAWTIFILLQPFLTSFFIYLFLREIKLSFRSTLVASTAFTYGLYCTVWLEYGNIVHALLWLPLALYLIEHIVKTFSYRLISLLTLCLLFSLLAGHIQTTFYVFGVVYLYFIFRLITIERKTLSFLQKGLVFFSGILALLAASPQLLSTWEIFQLSAREAYSLDRVRELLLPWFYPVTLFASDIFGNPASRNYGLKGTYIERVVYIGVIPFFFTLVGLFSQKKTKFPFFFITLAFLTLILTLDQPLARLFHSLSIPIISTTVPTRMLYLLSFSLSVLAGFGIEFWLENQKSYRIKIIGIIFLLAYLFLWFFAVVSGSVIAQRNMILPTIFVFFGLGVLFTPLLKKRKNFIFFVLIALSMVDLFFYFHKITPFVPATYIFPQTEVMSYIKEKGGINRFWGYGTGYIDTNFSTFWKNYSVEGNDPLFSRRYGEFISVSDDGQVITPLPRADVNVVSGYGPNGMRENFYRQKVLNLLGVKYVLQKNDTLGEIWQPDYQTFPSEVYQLVWQKEYWQIYENKQALPRIFLAYDYNVETNGQKIIDQLMRDDFLLSKKIILEEKLPETLIPVKVASGQIISYDYQPNKIAINLFTSGNGLLFLSDNYFPGWKVKVDDSDGKIYRADYTFRAVPVTEGEHRVVFTYEPTYWQTGEIISFFALMFIVFLFFIKRKKLK